jgi:hypothetical protein
MYSRVEDIVWSPCLSRPRRRLKAGLQAIDIQTTLRELPLDKLEKLGEMLAELKKED